MPITYEGVLAGILAGKDANEMREVTDVKTLEGEDSCCSHEALLTLLLVIKRPESVLWVKLGRCSQAMNE